MTDDARSKPPVIAVIGAGAMGSLYGGLLAPFAEVTILDDWREQIDAIRANGLTLTGISGVLRPKLAALHAEDAATIAGEADIAIALVNAGGSAEAAKVARTVLKADGYLLTLQNGIGNIEAYEAALGPGRVLAGLSYHSAALRGLARAEHTHRGPTWIGEIDRRRTERLAALEALLEKAGGMPHIVDDVVGYVWSKFIHNCAINAVCAVGGIRVGEIPTTPGADEMQTRIIEEALAVVKAKGIDLADEDPMTAIKAFCRVKFNKPSMLQHLEASRETEIGALNGAVVRLGAALGIPTPYNQAISWMVESMQHHRIKMLREPDIDYDALERQAKAAAK
jgi:2-dehydropantoate 2-reductase